MEIAQQKGLGAWLIWATANAGTLAVFGALTRSGLLARHVFDVRAIKALALVIQVFCLVIQLNIINKVIMQMSGDPLLGYVTATATGVIFTAAMYRNGLLAAIVAGWYQWAACMLAIVLILAVGTFTGAGRVYFPESSSADLLWGVWSACILLAGPIGDVQHWQRAEAARGSRAYYHGAVLFAVYMLLVLTMAAMEFSLVMQALLLVAVLCVTSSTIDAIAVAMHEISSKRLGTALALLICVFWGLFAKVGVIELWSKAGVYRVVFALIILAIALIGGKRIEARKDSGIKANTFGKQRKKARGKAD